MRKALVLSGGGAKGAAHVGVIKALEEAGFRPDFIVGVSIGAVVGAGYALLGDASLLWRYAHKVYKRALKFFPFDFSALDHKYSPFFAKLGCWYMSSRISVLPSWIYFGIFRHYLKRFRFEDVKIPFCCIACDLNSGEDVFLSSGRLLEAVEASMSIPGIFPPIKLQGRLLVDGGTLNNLPVSAARKLGAEYVVAVNLMEKQHSPKKPETSNQILTTINEAITEKLSTLRREEEKADFLIIPPVSHIGTLKFRESFELMESSYTYTKGLLKKREIRV
ncbi:MAG: patatin-like phospholipase family protein [Kosmotoga sp.]|uniref:patatin-like phospholipase family protein n=1 Tax=Kosmotoga sp. TaxID=1955248 RepID=UPI001D6DE8B4|nr:patatin-like phospholipase family protein [Kosmotoga sp.]MBO8166407.1 patatin-like phospholipase family protein [Kosmotoga sp.]